MFQRLPLTGGGSARHTRDMADDHKALRDTFRNDIEKNWARLSPTFRAAHNRLRAVRGQPPIPSPKRDLYVAPQATARPVEPADDLEAAAAVEEFNGLAGEDAQLWMRVAKRLALDNAQTQLHDRELKTEVLYTAIIKIATWYLIDPKVPEAKRTITNAHAVVMEAFGAKFSNGSWTGGEVHPKTVWNVLTKAEGEAYVAALFQLYILQFRLRGFDARPKWLVRQEAAAKEILAIAD
jgi:hypothetical protein